MKVPLLDLPAQQAELGPDLEQALARVMSSGQFILGPEVAALEREVAALSGVAHAVAVSSGSDALLLSLWALGVGPGDEVLTTALSFFATVGAIVRLGARPVFADIDPSTFNLDPADVQPRLGPRTRAIVPVHLFGRLAELEPLAATGLPLVEDAAQACGAPSLARLGRTATLSFFPSKNLGAAGDAGMVLTNDAALAERLGLMRSHGAHPKYVHELVGGNFRMDALQAAILRAKLPHLAGWNQRRRQNVARYRELLAATPLTLPADAADPAHHVWHQFVVRAPRRDQLKQHLASRGIESEIYYPRPLHLQPCFLGLEYQPGDLPQAERAAEEVLALPIHPQLAEAQLEHVATTVKAFYA